MGKSAARIVRQQQALDLRVTGARYRDIGLRLGVSHVQAFRDVTEALAEVTRKTHEKIERLRQMEVLRCDEMHCTLWPQAMAGDVRAVRALLAIMDHRAKLLGLYAKQQIGVTGENDGPVTTVVRHIYITDADAERGGLAASADPDVVPGRVDPARG